MISSIDEQARSRLDKKEGSGFKIVSVTVARSNLGLVYNLHFSLCVLLQIQIASYLSFWHYSQRIFSAHDSNSNKHHPSYKETVKVARYNTPSPCSRIILADPLPPFERACERKPVYNSQSSSEESLSPSRPTQRRPPQPKRKPKRTQSSSNDLSGSSTGSKFVFTPAQVYPIASSRSSTSFLARKSVSSPLLFDLQTSPPPYTKHPFPVASSVPPSHMNSDSDTDDDRDEDDMIYTSRLGANARPASSSSQSLRSRIFGLASRNPSRVRDKPISTTPGVLCAGETEPETDEPISSRHLPTARIIPSSGPLVPPNTLERLTPLLFEFCRLLSIVPAIFGTLYNLYHIYRPPTYDNTIPNTRPPPERVDYFISALWAVLTGYQCLSLATGLLTRWRLYYPPLSTLVRLLALQGICWPGTHFTLTILEHEKRPVICWAVIGTFTCLSRSVQIWVTSNLWWEKKDDGGSGGPSGAAEESRRTYWKRWGGKWGGRRWDWKEVGVKCVLPPGIVYFVMAWAEQLRREWALQAAC
ncbi:hypothetical protein GALMADRAFT_212843 [Galerina marginata CBS 339.88]|uniref:N-glycosylation protein EOS1 n=1 Tax=Galerina marginata (strain CBS 339.88) TaxID=685588 RepID=A0A067SRZ3_GALM3|nr:hypothetical protein GALMADRAFT_212843 [Galerina marginata CBS 339.88]